MAQTRLIDADTRKKAAATAAARTARLANTKTMSDISANLNKPDVAALSALTKLLDTPAVYENPEKQLEIQKKIQIYINKSQNNSLRNLTEKQSARYGGNRADMDQILIENEIARRVAEQTKTKSKD